MRMVCCCCYCYCNALFFTLISESFIKEETLNMCVCASVWNLSVLLVVVVRARICMQWLAGDKNVFAQRARGDAFFFGFFAYFEFFFEAIYFKFQ